jgi:hypothetical protein
LPGAHRTFLLLVACFLLASCRSNATPKPDLAPPLGALGPRIGTYLRIEGTRDSSGKVGPNSLLVTRVNGVECEPTPIWLDNLALPMHAHVKLSGYESGRWIGVPPEVLEAGHVSPHQAMWQFSRFFIVTSVQEPADLAAQFARPSS